MQYLILHGSFGSNQGNWFAWLKGKLESLGHKVVCPQMPVEDYDEAIKAGTSFVCKNQSLDKWMYFFEKNVLPEIDTTQPLIMIGHSLAPAFILDVLEKHNIQLEQAIFVAPFLETDKDDPAFYSVNHTFYLPVYDFEKLKKLCKESIVFYGDNDPYVPASRPIDFAQKLGSKVIVIPNGGHLNAEFGYTSFPKLFEVIKK
jgi:predicted alpha/beta hydrolase family esterase